MIYFPPIKAFPGPQGTSWTLGYRGQLGFRIVTVNPQQACIYQVPFPVLVLNRC